MILRNENSDFRATQHTTNKEFQTCDFSKRETYHVHKVSNNLYYTFDSVSIFSKCKMSNISIQ